MAGSGKDLEELVALVERALAKSLGKSLLVRTGQRTYLADGSQEAEFDVEVFGDVGGARFAWSIECRDRPKKGPADVPWIQQLAGRRQQFKHSRVTAVSTTGFTRAAKHAAKVLDIELRVVERLSAEAFRGWWPGFDAMSVVEQRLQTDAWNLILPNMTDAIEAEAKEFMAKGVKSDAKVLKTSNRDEMHSLDDAVHGFLRHKNFWLNVPPTGTPHAFKFLIGYENDNDHYLLPLPSGADVRVRQIQWAGKLTAIETAAAVTDRKEYREDGSAEVISQVMAFEAVSLGGKEPVRMELHRIGDPSKPTILQFVVKPIAKAREKPNAV